MRQSRDGILNADDRVIEGLLTAQTGSALNDLCAAAVSVRDAGRRGTRVATFSPKVFLPVTRLCRDSCGYCTFVRSPSSTHASYLSVDAAIATAAAGAAAGATEALLTLGDAPETVHPAARAELNGLGFETTIDYVASMAAAVREATGLLPHTNLGLVDDAQAAKLRRVAVSQGVMLETSAPALPAHAGCVTKTPSARLAALASLGRARVPTTTGLLVGVGESVGDRLAGVLAIARANAVGGAHVAECIIQPFRPKPGTAMAGAPPASTDAVRWAIAVARLVLGAGVAVQSPPNLAASPSDWRAALAAGACDFGGISPVTADHVNPEAGWPALDALAEAAAAEGLVLAPRLPIYPRHIQELTTWVDTANGPASLAAAVRRGVDGCGLARGSGWRPGGGRGSRWLPPAEAVTALPAALPPQTLEVTPVATDTLPASAPTHAPRWRVSVDVRGALPGASVPRRRRSLAATLTATAAGTHRLTLAEATAALSARGDDAAAVVEAADAARRTATGNIATFVVNQNINYTNVCSYGCTFCAFSVVAPGGGAAALRAEHGAATESPYLLSFDEIGATAAAAVAAGATEVCLQGGIHPSFTGVTYVSIVRAVKAAAPGVHVHAFSPLEIAHGASTLGLPIPTFLARLKDAGLGSLPGTAAEVLRPGPRRVLCPDKLGGGAWLRVIGAAHAVGLPTTSTLMFGAADGPTDWAVHLAALRGLQDRTRGLTEFVPLPFVADAAPGLATGSLRSGPTLREAVAVHAVARLFFVGCIDNVQVSM